MGKHHGMGTPVLFGAAKEFVVPETKFLEIALGSGAIDVRFDSGDTDLIKPYRRGRMKPGRPRLAPNGILFHGNDIGRKVFVRLPIL